MSVRAALLIGSGAYEDATLSRLAAPEVDVGRLAEVLADPRLGAFDDVEILVDEAETKVRRAVADFFDRRTRDDLLLLYYSGHGLRDDLGRLHLAARDTRYDRLKASAIASAFVVECMDECRSRRQILILDCCNAGAFARGTKGDRTAMTAQTFEGNGFGRVVLTASDATQYALEGDRVIEEATLSLFTHHLVTGLVTGAAARPGAPEITLDDWYEYAYRKVVESTPTQTPRKWSYNQEGALLIARTPLAPATAPEEAAPHADALHVPTPTVPRSEVRPTKIRFWGRLEWGIALMCVGIVLGVAVWEAPTNPVHTPSPRLDLPELEDASTAMPLGGRGRITIAVQNPSGGPLEGAAVRFYPEDRGTLTDHAGIASVTLPAGTHLITAMALGYAPYRDSIHVEPDFERRWGVRLRESAIALEDVQVRRRSFLGWLRDLFD